MIAIHHQVRNHKTASYMATFPRLKSNIPIKTQRLKRFLGWKFSLKKQYAKNPHYNPGAHYLGGHGPWSGYYGPKDANPHWRESGYRPSKEQAAKPAAAKGMNEWIEKQRGAHPDAAHSPQSDRGDLHNVNLMRSAREAELVHAPQKVVGDASLKISMHGFPKGTKTESKINGMFKTLTMYRGLAAPMADQEG
jgi:hypothetical protein